MRIILPLMITTVMLGLAGSVYGAEPNPGNGQITLADQGKSNYVIVLAADRSLPEQRAAQELAQFLKEVTGAEFAIVAPAERGPRPAIAVGPGAARELVPGLDLTNLGQEGIVIQSQPPNLVLTGGPGALRGTLYAVYSFLEDTVGCRWWTKDESDIPRRPTLIIPELKQRYIPTFEYRDAFWYMAFDPDWSVRNKCNPKYATTYPCTQKPALDETRGGGVGYLGQGVHTFNAILPPAKYFPKHPEWFSEIGGKRVGPPTISQWCLTNMELLAFCIQQVKETLRTAPPDSIVSISQNDAANRCQCGRCQAIEQVEGSPSGPLLRFVNAVADAIKDDYPRAAVDTLAYGYTIKPPRLAKPRPNVIIRLCVSATTLVYPLDNERNRAFAEDLKGWSAICKRLYIWDYVTCFGGYFTPFPNLRTLGPNMRFFASHGVKGVFEQGAYTSAGGEFSGLRAWVQAKLLWNPAADDRLLIRQFVEGYFGPAAPSILEYIRLLHDTAEKSGYDLGCGVPPNAPYLTIAMLTQAETLFQQAEAAVKDSPDLLRRVQLAHASIQYAVLNGWLTLRQEAQAKNQPWVFGATTTELMNRFVDVCHANRVAVLMESNTASPEWFKRKFELTTGLRAGITPPAICKDLPDTAWVDFQEDMFPSGLPYGEVRPDPMASNGKATWMPSTHQDWAIQLYLPIALWLNDPNQEWMAYVVVRVEKKGKGESTAFSYGMYDVDQRKGIASDGIDGHTVKLADLKDDSYQVYKVAQTELSYNRYVWVAPTLNPDNVAGIWVDRIFLVRAPGKP